MKRFLTMALAGVLALGLGSAAYAVECALDVVPASTLLFPYVSYDFDQGRDDDPVVADSGQTTLFAITNVSNEAVIVHVTVWTDYSVAILDFNLTLTGYDVQTINIRDIFREGILPSDDTGANEWWDGVPLDNAGPPPLDDGPYSTFNELWGTALNPYFNLYGLPDPDHTGGLDCDPAIWDSSPINYRGPAGNIPSGTLAIFEGYLRSSETVTTGYADCGWTGDVTGLFPLGTWFSRQDPRATAMYITADVVNACNKDLPDGDAITYFAFPVVAGVRVANVLMGDQIWLDSGNNYSEADNAVHLEADPAFQFGGSTPTATKFSTFYHNLHGGIPGTQDFREPLPTAWGFRYMNAPGTDVFTWIRAWKGSMLNPVVRDLGQDPDVFAPILGPSPAEIWAESCIPYTYYAWDEDENVNTVREVPPWSGTTDEPVPVPDLFPLETQEVGIDEFFVVENADGNFFGWMMVIWARSNTNPLIADPALMDPYQTWMGVKYAALGQYTAGFSGAVLANYNCDATQILPALGFGPSTP